MIWDRLGYEKPSSGSGLPSFNDSLVIFYDLKSNFHEILLKCFFREKMTKNEQKHKIFKNRKLRSRCLLLPLWCQKWIEHLLIVFLRCSLNWILKKHNFLHFFPKNYFYAIFMTKSLGLFKGGVLSFLLYRSGINPK